jgi:hypothetical protein
MHGNQGLSERARRVTLFGPLYVLGVVVFLAFNYYVFVFLTVLSRLTSTRIHLAISINYTFSHAQIHHSTGLIPFLLCNVPLVVLGDFVL